MKYIRYQDVPKFTTPGSWQVSMPLDTLISTFDKWSQGIDTDLKLDLNPDFQRAHVWTEAQQIAWLEFFVRGGKTGRTIYLNHPGWQTLLPSDYAEFVIVDGKQRVEAIRRFLAGEIRIFGSCAYEFTDRLRLHEVMQVNINILPTRAAVLQWYLEFNSGGTQHTEEEIARVRQLLKDEQAKG